ncbi:hypothetical protein DICVIV_06618 [Dictyocaulus viviparus]|uniref:7TM GPCR serpentine receptor class x (Srx) domain-containing protein n=1 Tax=Dictyocaulus viviparus TaxID=29172 RepID=A0A0D8XU28_DICVI|nr:hypothetical protein DICVIV_06618 [Dictyocaulus viviparus]
MAWFFATFAPQSNSDLFYNYPHTANNIFIVAITGLLYIVYSKVLLRHVKITNKLTWAQKSYFIQSTLICMANLVASLVYVYMQFFPTPQCLIFIGQLCWQFGHGFPAFVYLLLNKTIQRQVLKMLRIDRYFSTVHPFTGSKRQLPSDR